MAQKGMLVIMRGYGRGNTFKLGARTLTIGRDKGNLIQLIDDSVSRRHVLIKWTDLGYELSDLNSYNGTYVNKKRVTNAKLNMGEFIKVGETELRLVADRADVRDATQDRKVVDQMITGEVTRYVSASQVGDQSVENQPISIEEKASSSEQNIAMMLRNLATLENFLDIALNIIDVNINPDRIIVFKRVKGTKLKVIASHFNPEIEKEDCATGPVRDILIQVMSTGRSILNNNISGTYPQEMKIATAVAVGFPGRDGMIYIDSFLNRKKYFMDFDLALLEKVSKTIGGRLQ